MTNENDLSPIERQVLGILTDSAPKAHDRTTVAFALVGCEMPPTRTFHAMRLVADHCLSRLLERGYLTVDPSGRHQPVTKERPTTENPTP